MARRHATLKKGPKMRGRRHVESVPRRRTCSPPATAKDPPCQMGDRNRMPRHRMRGMKKSVPKSVDEYIAAQPEAVRPKLEEVRAAIRKAVPEAVEGIGYRMPGYKLHGKPMLYFAGFKEHYSLFAASGTFFTALEDELRGYELRQGTVHFPLTKPVPVKLISRIAKLRAAGIAAATKEPLLGREKERRMSAQ